MQGASDSQSCSPDSEARRETSWQASHFRRSDGGSGAAASCHALSARQDCRVNCRMPRAGFAVSILSGASLEGPAVRPRRFVECGTGRRFLAQSTVETTDRHLQLLDKKVPDLERSRLTRVVNHVSAV